MTAMSNFAQIITSFERAGNFPLEANYIFPTVEDLKQFYSDEIQAATLHKGLFRIVENNGNDKQALYWVTKKQTNDELEFTEFIAGQDITEIKTQLDELLAKLTAEETARKNADTALWGVTDPSDVEEGYNSINDLATQAKALQAALKALEDKSITGDDSVKAQLKATVGTTDNDIIAYLKTLPYQSVTELANALDKVVNGTGDTTDAIDTLAELKAFLIGYTNKDTLQALLDKLWNTLEGETLPSENFRTLRGIEDYLIEYKTANDYKQGTLLEEMNNVETGVGLNADGSFSADAETYYLQNATSVMNALKTLDELLHKYISANTPSVRNEDEAVYLSLTQELDSYVLAAALKLSTQAGNQIIKNSDGLYSCAKTYYKDGTLTFTVNGNIISQHYIGMSAIVQAATYDKDNEQLVFVFKLDSGDTQTVNIPVGALIREWEPYNRDTSPVVLERTQVIAGTDQLSADIRLSTLQYNILVRDGNTLYVKGSTDNIYHDGTLLSTYLDSYAQEQSEIISDIQGNLVLAKDDRNAIKQSLELEINSRTSEIARIDKELTNQGSSIQENQQAVAKEATDRKDADNTLSEKISAEAQRAALAETKLDAAISNEVKRAEQIEDQHSQVLQTLTEDLNAEVKRAIAADQDLENKIAGITHPEYKIEKQSTPESGCIATYLLTKDGAQAGNKIDIPETPVKVSATYVDGVLTLIVNDETVGIFDLGLAAVVKDSYYDSANNDLVIEYNLHNNKTQIVRTSLKNIIDKIEDATDNLEKQIEAIKVPEYTIVKQAVPSSGSSATYTLTKDNETVGQKIEVPEQTSENISTASGKTVQAVLDELTTELAKKANTDSPILTGIPQVETSPDLTDSSQRIPSTAWTTAKLEEYLQKATQALEWIDITDESNP